MKKRNTSGLFLRRKTVQSHTVWLTALLGWLLYCGWLLLGHAVTGFADTAGWITAPAVGTAACLLWLVLQLRGRQRFVLPVLLGTGLLLALVFLRDLSDALVTVWSRAGALWTEAMGRLVLTPAASGPLQPWAMPLFSAVCALALAAVCCQLAVHMPRLASAILAAGALAAVILLGAERTGWLLPVMLIAVTVPVMEDRGGGRMAAVRAGVCAALTVVFALLCLAVPPIRTGVVFRSLRHAAETGLHRLRYETSVPQLPEGDFSRPVETITSEETVLRITMEQPEELYLRGFVGDRFDGERWSPVSKQAAAEESALLYWLHVDGFWPQTQLSLTMQEQPSNRVAVENVAACSEYLYTPYHMSRLLDGEAMMAVELLPSALEAKGLRGDRAYQFTTVYAPAELLADTIARLQQEEEPVYRSLEGSYRKFVLEQDLQLPEGGMTSMVSALEAYAALYGGREAMTMEEAEACVLVFLQKYLAEGELTLPLADAAEGTVYQTATATVLALRYFDIPARYVEGYLVSAELAQTAAAGQVLEVPASCAYAWAEVYQDGVGWIPLALTPGLQTIAGQVSDSLQQLHGAGLTEGEGDAVLPEGEELEQEEEEEEDDPSDEAAERTPLVDLIKSPWFWLGLLVLVLALLAAMALRRYWIVKKRRALLEQENPREALCCQFSDAARLLEQLGLRRQGGSMLALTQAEAVLGADLAQQLRQTAQLNNEALFSSHPIGQEQREYAAQFRSAVLQHLRKTAKWRQKLVMQWVKCLY